MLIPIAVLLLGAPPAHSPAWIVEPLPVLTSPMVADTYDSLMEAFAKAKADRRAEIKATKSPKERRALRAKGVAIDFLPRFEALGKSGEVRAFLWMLDEAKGLGIDKDGRVAHALDVYGKIVMAPAGSEHFTAAIRQLGEDTQLDPIQRVSLLKRVLGRADAVGEGQCTARLFAGSLLMKSGTDSDKAMGEQILKELVANEDCSALVQEAQNALLGVSLEVGGLAPDFKGTTIDGETFNLYDYRGKVVLIDFFGFW